jgi:hypothetical protein
MNKKSIARFIPGNLCAHIFDELNYVNIFKDLFGDELLM